MSWQPGQEQRVAAPIILYPAIDLLGGHCVRLRQGDYARAIVFGDNPLAVARRWQASGAEWLHIVDLDGAREGRPAHLEVVARIVEATGLPVQLGGGLRMEDDIAAAFDAGATRVILGTAAARDPALLRRCLARWGERIAVAVDARDGRVAVFGWLETTGESALDLARRMVETGVRTLVVTSIERDGTLAGGDMTGLHTLRAALPGAQLIAAGGIATIGDVRALARLGLDGAVLGHALYAGALDLATALRVAREEAAEIDEWSRAKPSEAKPSEVGQEADHAG
jgi:phosphoribosylformimino-5-aminoimidazole carboxamide ribotide isomerase